MYAFAVSQGSTLELKIHEVGVDVFILYFLLGFFSKADLREGDHGELNLPGVDDPHLSTDTVIEFLTLPLLWRTFDNKGTEPDPRAATL